MNGPYQLSALSCSFTPGAWNQSKRPYSGCPRPWGECGYPLGAFGSPIFVLTDTSHLAEATYICSRNINGHLLPHGQGPQGHSEVPSCVVWVPATAYRALEENFCSLIHLLNKSLLCIQTVIQTDISPPLIIKKIITVFIIIVVIIITQITANWIILLYIWN